MKRITKLFFITILIPAILVLFITSCKQENERRNNLFKSNNQIADETFQAIVSAVEERDSTKLTKLFAGNLQGEELDSNAQAFIDFISGKIVAYSKAAEYGVGSSRKKDYGRVYKDIQPVFWLETQSDRYYVAIKECTKDNYNVNNVGVISLYIINAKDWQKEYVYGGDGKWTPGINIDNGQTSFEDN